MIRGFHWFFALASAMVMTLAGLEASRRALVKRPPGALAARIAGIVLLLLGVTAASGLGMFLGGAHPYNELHFLYALLAFGAIPVANALGSRGSPRRCALTTAVGALFGLVLIVRLFMTG
jgi:CDP-diglyceride synthetase